MFPIAHAQSQTGSLSGSVTDADFGGPVAGARVQIVEARLETTTNERGVYTFDAVPVGVYNVVVSEREYQRTAKSGIAVQSGQLTDYDFELQLRFEVLDPFVAEPTLVVASSFEGLLELRAETPSILDVVGTEDFAKQGVSSVDQALAAVPGATVADDATAVIRGLPDRYVPSLVNGVRLPSASEEKRAVELDQFPTNIVETIQVSKTFLPDSQGDASGGSVDVRLKGIPEDRVFNFSLGTSYNSQASNEGGFLGYDGSGPGFLGRDADNRREQLDKIGENWEGAVGVSGIDAPDRYKFAGSVGDSFELDNGMKIGGFLSLFYERDSSHYDNGQNNRLWVKDPAEGLAPVEVGSGSFNSFDAKTALFDLVRSSEQVQWGGTASAGIEFNRDHSLSLQYLYTHTAEDRATLAEDTRGKYYRYPDYDPSDPTHPGNSPDRIEDAPFIRTHSLEYTERTIGTLQLRGDHVFRMDDVEWGDSWTWKSPELDWVAASSFSKMDQPDKRLFGAVYSAASFQPGVPGFTPDVILPSQYTFFKPGESTNLGNLQRIFSAIDEDSTQGALNLSFPFEQWANEEGKVKIGYFQDGVDREFRRDSYTNPGGGFAQDNIFLGSFGTYWTDNWSNENHPIEESLEDVDYDGSIDIQSWYGMMDLPVASNVRLIGGARVENTDIGVTLLPEDNVLWIPPGATISSPLLPGDADVDQSRRDVLPALTGIWDVNDRIQMRAALSKTIARQTFRELTPILQREFQGGPVFIGNPELEMAELDNYDLRIDYEPTDTTFLSASYFYKDVTNPIENVQRLVDFSFTTPVNYPDGELEGFELEARQELGEFWENLEGLSLGFNATFIDSQVTFSDEQLEEFDRLPAAFDFPYTTRDATNAPKRLFNLFLNYNLRETGTQFGLFYTVQGDTLVAGDSTQDATRYIPAIYQKEFGTLNLTFAQRLTDHINLRIAAKNLTNPSIDEVYRSPILDGDTLFTTYTRGVQYSVGISASYTF